MPSSLYTRDILRLAASIPHLGRLERPGATSEKRSSTCGSRVLVDVVIDGAGRVKAFGQEVQACALGQASASLLGATVIGRTFGELGEARDTLSAYLAGKSDDLGTWSEFGVFANAREYSARHAAILLAFEAAAEASSLAARADAA